MTYKKVPKDKKTKKGGDYDQPMNTKLEGGNYASVIEQPSYTGETLEETQQYGGKRNKVRKGPKKPKGRGRSVRRGGGDLGDFAKSTLKSLGMAGGGTDMLSGVKDFLGMGMKGGDCGCAGTQPTGMSGGAIKLEKNKRKELYSKARKYDVKGRSKMSKKQLVNAVRSAQKALGEKLRRRSSSKGRKVPGSPRR
jgi:hypothetical protein